MHDYRNYLNGTWYKHVSMPHYNVGFVHSTPVMPWGGYAKTMRLTRYA